MHKKLKKRILEACGINDQISKEERFGIAHSILNDYDKRQKICNSLQGVSYKDVDKALKQFTQEFANMHQSDDSYEDTEVPEKYGYEDPVEEPEWVANVTPAVYGTYTKEQVAWLLSQKTCGVVEEPEPPMKYDSTYFPEEVEALLKGDYDYKRFKYLRKKKYY